MSYDGVYNGCSQRGGNGFCDRGCDTGGGCDGRDTDCFDRHKWFSRVYRSFIEPEPDNLDNNWRVSVRIYGPVDNGTAFMRSNGNSDGSARCNTKSVCNDNIKRHINFRCDNISQPGQQRQLWLPKPGLQLIMKYQLEWTESA